MRPRRLEITAIGPYPASVRLDFDVLDAEGLYLISGPTGGGKTFLLDAITYALYGHVPGDRHPDRLRSHHADPRTESGVALEFALRGEDYRVTRVPPHERAKKAGRGTTVQKAKATLTVRRGGGWEPLAEGVEEVGTLVVDLVGLTARQFTQVVLLPQGQFADALKARPKERSELLSSLFHTERFREYTDRLGERARAAEAELADIAIQIGSLTQQALTRGGEALEGCGDGDAAVNVLAARLRRAADEAEAVVTVRGEAARAARAAREAAGVAAERWRRRHHAMSELAELEAGAAELADLTAAVGTARRAAPCAPLVTTLTRAQRRRDTATLDRRGAANRVQEMLERLGPLGPAGDPEVWSGEDPPSTAAVAELRESIRQVSERLGKLVTAYRDWHDGIRAADEAQQAADQAAAQAARLAEHLAQLDARRPALDAAKEVAGASRALLDTARSEHQRLREVAAAAAKLPELRQIADDAADLHQGARALAVAALENYHALLQRRIGGMAAELAAQLVAGEACQVCGSTEHPDPARPAAEPATVEQIEGAAEAAQVASDTADRVRDEAAAAAAALADTLARVAGQDAGQAQAAADRAALSLETHEQRARAYDLICRRIAAADAARADGAAKVAELRVEAATLQTTAAQRWTAAARHADELEEALGSLTDPAPALKAADDTAEAAAQLCAAVEAEQRASDDALATEATLHQLARGQGFPDAASALEAAMEPDDLEAAEAVLAAVAERRRHAETTLAELGADDTPAPDLEAMEAACQEAEAQAAGAHRRHERLTSAAADVARLAAAIDRLRRHRGERLHHAQRLRRLADICAGSGNALRMSLERYVLAAYLEEITEAASVRLQAMTDGRYTLHHSDERARHGAASGLSIVVHDAFTGTVRDTGTLSGGETFCASLSLALAVADVAQRHAGGVHLDTLFVDEGFGTLDAEALEQALAELERLREGGRLVGVISHVPALRERITAGIEIVRTPHGSDARVVVLTAV